MQIRSTIYLQLLYYKFGEYSKALQLMEDFFEAIPSGFLSELLRLPESQLGLLLFQAAKFSFMKKNYIKAHQYINLQIQNSEDENSVHVSLQQRAQNYLILAKCQEKFLKFSAALNNYQKSLQYTQSYLAQIQRSFLLSSNDDVHNQISKEIEQTHNYITHINLKVEKLALSADNLEPGKHAHSPNLGQKPPDKSGA